MKQLYIVIMTSNRSDPMAYGIFDTHEDADDFVIERRDLEDFEDCDFTIQIIRDPK